MLKLMQIRTMFYLIYMQLPSRHWFLLSIYTFNRYAVEIWQERLYSSPYFYTKLQVAGWDEVWSIAVLREINNSWIDMVMVSLYMHVNMWIFSYHRSSGVKLRTALHANIWLVQNSLHSPSLVKINYLVIVDKVQAVGMFIKNNGNAFYGTIYSSEVQRCSFWIVSTKDKWKKIWFYRSLKLPHNSLLHVSLHHLKR